MSQATKVRALIVDDNPTIRSLVAQTLQPLCDVVVAEDGAEALLRAVDDPPALIIADFRMPGLDGRQLYDKLRARESTRHIPFIFMASRGDIEDRLRPSIGSEDFLTKPFFAAELTRMTKRVLERVQLELLQSRASRPGVMQGRLEEMGVVELMQSMEMGQKSCRLTLTHAGETCEMYFASGQCKDAKSGHIEGDDAVFRAIGWTEGEFEIDFTGTTERSTTTRSTTGLLMEAMRLLDEANANKVSS
jgi:CheY-like chemotaxis protein